MKKDVFSDYLIGLYVYNIYTNFNIEINITGDEDIFYYVLGWHINQSYPDIYNKLIKSL